MKCWFEHHSRRFPLKWRNLILNSKCLVFETQAPVQGNPEGSFEEGSQEEVSEEASNEAIDMQDHANIHHLVNAYSNWLHGLVRERAKTGQVAPVLGRIFGK